MKAVLLCAGYGTRFASDIENDKSGQFKHLSGIPKPLLPVGSQALILHWLDIFSSAAEISEVVLITNEIHKERYVSIVEDYLKQKRSFTISIISDGSTCNESRTGAVGCMNIGAGSFQNDILFVAGDTLLHHSFNLNEMIEKFQSLKCTEHCHCLLISTSVSDEDVSKRGIIEINSNGLVTSFLEKPQPSETLSRLQSPCVYLMSHEANIYLNNFLECNKEQPLSSRDATGNFIKYLVSEAPVFTYNVQTRYDIGNLQMYIECNNIFQKSK